MNLGLVTAWDRLRASPRALPFGMMVAGAGLAAASLSLRLEVASDETWWLYSGTAKGLPDSSPPWSAP